MACVAAAALTWLLNLFCNKLFNFDVGFMNILVNAVLTMLFLFTIKTKQT